MRELMPLLIKGTLVTVEIAPIHRFVQHLGEERGVGVRAETEHRASLG